MFFGSFLFFLVQITMKQNHIKQIKKIYKSYFWKKVSFGDVKKVLLALQDNPNDQKLQQGAYSITKRIHTFSDEDQQKVWDLIDQMIEDSRKSGEYISCLDELFGTFHQQLEKYDEYISSEKLQKEYEQRLQTPQIGYKNLLPQEVVDERWIDIVLADITVETQEEDEDFLGHYWKDCSEEDWTKWKEAWKLAKQWKYLESYQLYWYLCQHFPHFFRGELLYHISKRMYIVYKKYDLLSINFAHITKKATQYDIDEIQEDLEYLVHGFEAWIAKVRKLKKDYEHLDTIGKDFLKKKEMAILSLSVVKASKQREYAINFSKEKNEEELIEAIQAMIPDFILEELLQKIEETEDFRETFQRYSKEKRITDNSRKEYVLPYCFERLREKKGWKKIYTYNDINKYMELLLYDTKTADLSEYKKFFEDVSHQKNFKTFQQQIKEDRDLETYFDDLFQYYPKSLHHHINDIQKIIE